VQQRLLHVPVAYLAIMIKSRLPQRIGQCVVIAFGVDADFALVDDGLLVLEQVFDRVFEGQYVARPVVVAIIIIAAAGRFAGASRAGTAQTRFSMTRFSSTEGASSPRTRTRLRT